MKRFKTWVDGHEYLTEQQGNYLLIRNGNTVAAPVLCSLSIWSGFEEVDSSEHEHVPRDIFDAWMDGDLTMVVVWAVSTLPA